MQFTFKITVEVRPYRLIFLGYALKELCNAADKVLSGISFDCGEIEDAEGRNVSPMESDLRELHDRHNDFICPMPQKWNEIYISLLKVWERGLARPDDKPPVPLILAAWHESTDEQKKERWRTTIDWAYEYNCPELIPELGEVEKFRG